MSKKIKLSGGILAMGAVLILLAGCGADAGGTSGSGAVKIGVPLPFTGPSAAVGEQSRRGSDLAASEINAAGGCLPGRDVELLYENDKSTPEGGVAAVQKLMSQGGAVAIAGGMTSSVVLAEASITKDQILHVNTAGQADAITENGGKYLFQINNTVSQSAKVFNKYITGTLAPKSVAYMGEDTAFNAGVLDILTKDLATAKIDLVDTAEYQTDTTDFSAILTRLKSKKPDLLYVADATPPRTATLMQQLRQTGGFPAVVFSPGVINNESLALAGKNLEGVITGEVYDASDDSPANAAFVAAFQKASDYVPGRVELASFESIKAICAAMTAAKSTTDYDAISAAMRELKLTTARGVLQFGAKGRAQASTFYIQRVHSSALVIVDQIAQK